MIFKAFIFRIMIHEGRSKYTTEEGALHRTFRCGHVPIAVNDSQVDIVGYQVVRTYC